MKDRMQTAMVIGAIPTYFWAKQPPRASRSTLAIAGGLIAGEIIGGHQRHLQVLALLDLILTALTFAAW